MTGTTTASACERARTWAALRPDGELSSIEGRLLDAHLERCLACHAFASDVAEMTVAIRSAPPEMPDLAFDVTAARRLRRRHRAGTVGRVSAAAAALVAAFGAGAIGTDLRTAPAAGPQPPAIGEIAGIPNEGDLIRAEWTAGQRAWLVYTARPYGVVPT